MEDLSYEIEQLWIEGYKPVTIAALLNCPVQRVYDWLEQEDLEDEEEMVSDESRSYGPAAYTYRS